MLSGCSRCRQVARSVARPLDTDNNWTHRVRPPARRDEEVSWCRRRGRKPVTVYGTADHPGARVGGVLFAGGGLVPWFDIARRTGRRPMVKEMMRNESTSEFSTRYLSAEELSSGGFDGYGGSSGLRSVCFPGLSDAAGTSGDPVISGSLPGDRVRPEAPGTRTLARRMGSRICVRVCVRNSANCMRLGATPATSWTGGSALTCVFETECHC